MPIDLKITLEEIEKLNRDGFALVGDGDRKVLYVEVDESDGNE